MSENKKKENAAYINRYDTVVAFLSIELIALVLFGLGGTTGLSILQIVSIFVALLAFPFIRNNYQGDFKKEALLSLVPLGLLLALLGFGPFWVQAYYGGKALSVILYGGLTLLGGLGLFVVGYATGHNKAIKPKYLVFAILVGLAAYVLITGVYNVVRYGPFYASRYAGMVYYYDGVVFPIAKESKALLGFEFKETTLLFAKASATILACSGIGLLGISPKKDKKMFIAVAAFALLGIIDLILVPFKKGLYIVLITYVVMGLAFLLHYLANKKEDWKQRIDKILKILFFVLIGLVVLGVLALVLDASNGFIRKMNIPKISASLSSDSSLLGKVRLSIEAALFNGNNGGLHRFSILSFLFGCTPSNIITTSIFEFDVLWQTGFVGFAALLVVLFQAIQKSKRFLANGTMSVGYRFIIVSLLLGSFLYFSLCNDESPMIYSRIFMPLSRNAMPFALIYLYGVISAHPSEEVAQ